MCTKFKKCSIIPNEFFYKGGITMKKREKMPIPKRLLRIMLVLFTLMWLTILTKYWVSGIAVASTQALAMCISIIISWILSNLTCLLLFKITGWDV